MTAPSGNICSVSLESKPTYYQNYFIKFNLVFKCCQGEKA